MSSVDERRAHWDAHVARFGLGPDREHHPRFGELTPTTVSEFHPDPARRMTFYTGVGHPHHLNDSPAPLFVSASTLARYRSHGDKWPVRASCTWAGDSGAYAALLLNKGATTNPWWDHPDEYGAMWVRFIEEIGWPPDFVPCQDYPCEADVLARTGMTVDEHQDLTTESYLYLAEEFPMVPWLPVLQGWRPADYVRHLRKYETAGVELKPGPVGVGSVCRRGSQRQIATVFNTLAPFGLRLHAFGLSINGLGLVAHLLDSSDSQAWSKTARDDHLMLPGCAHLSRPDPATGVRKPTDCRNCFLFAMRYREKALDAIRECDQRRQAAARIYGDDLLALLR
jgi:hypothetical protein